ncbi:MAG: NAD(P)H-dependent oxidoreductase subunit E [Ruminococcaceae bacterium]|nr:NAD(P)H-dependent oxidoreductase subunit E [Oscillospiraceae bacterium]
MNEERLNEIMQEEGPEPDRLIPILHRVQAEHGFLADESIRCLSERLGIPAARIYAVASFYEAFVFKRSGKYILRICDGTTCHSRGSRELLEAVYEKLGLTEENNTTADGLISVETVSCLGDCVRAPNAQLNGRVFPRQTLETIIDTVEIIQMTQEAIDE